MTDGGIPPDLIDARRVAARDERSSLVEQGAYLVRQHV